VRFASDCAVYVFCLPTSSSGLTCDRQRDLKRPWHEDIVFIPISRLLITKFSISSQAGSQERIVILAMMASTTATKRPPIFHKTAALRSISRQEISLVMRTVSSSLRPVKSFCAPRHERCPSCRSFNVELVYAVDDQGHACSFLHCLKCDWAPSVVQYELAFDLPSSVRTEEGS
jgi:hypothetical protein